MRDLSAETLLGVFSEEQLLRAKAPDVVPISRIVRKSGGEVGPKNSTVGFI